METVGVPATANYKRSVLVATLMPRPGSEDDPMFFLEAADFRAWLEEHHTSAAELWVGYHKKATGRSSVTWEDTVAEALCVGWIDGIRKSLGTESYMIRFTPRNPKSVWSQRNIELVEQLTAEERMKPEGLAAFAHRDVHPDSGYRATDAAVALTSEMVSEFKATPGAWAFYQAQPSGYRRQAASWVMGAKREETRRRRLVTLIDDSANGLRIKQLRRT